MKLPKVDKSKIEKFGTDFGPSPNIVFVLAAMIFMIVIIYFLIQ